MSALTRFLTRVAGASAKSPASVPGTHHYARLVGLSLFRASCVSVRHDPSYAPSVAQRTKGIVGSLRFSTLLPLMKRLRLDYYRLVITRL